MRFVWVSAAKLPMVIDATATTASINSQLDLAGQNAVRKMRSSSAKLAALDATLTKAAMVVGAPS